MHELSITAGATEAEQQIAALQAQIDRLTAKREVMKTLPSEPAHPEGGEMPVVWWVKFWGGETPYEYIANHVPGKGWVVSHQHKKKYLTWNEVLDFALLREANGYVPEFFVATSWVALTSR